MIRRLFSALTVMVAVASLAPAAGSATPSEGRLSASSEEITWSGSFDQAQRYGCVGSIDPICDHFLLYVDAPPRQAVTVAITSADDGADLDLRVYGPDGQLKASSATAGSDEAVSFAHDAASDEPYEVQVQPFAIPEGGASYEGFARLGGRPDHHVDCVQATPATLTLPGTDSGAQLGLDVLVLLDDVPEERGQELMADARRSYDPLGIELRPTFSGVDFSDVGTETTEVIQAAKDHLGGRTPDGVDVVHVLTSKDLVALGQQGVGGQADCVGGIASPRRSFSVSEAYFVEPIPFGPLTLYVDMNAKAVAHEIGHLLGAHHHYGNCVEGNDAEEIVAGDVSTCTLMGPSADFIDYPFSTLNAAIVHGHAVAYVTP